MVNAAREDFLELLRRILEDVAEGEIDTRKLNSVDDAADYVRKLSYKPKGGTTSIEDAERVATEARNDSGTSDDPPHERREPERRAQQTRKALDRLFPKGLVSGRKQLKLERLIEEGQRLKLVDAPHAAAFLLRSTLEIALTLWLKDHKKYTKIVPSNTKHGPSLEDMLSFVNKNPADMGLDPVENAVPAAVPAGALNRIFALCTVIKKATGYTVEIGLQMGIVGEEDTSEATMPEFTLKVESGPDCQCVRLGFKKFGEEAAIIEQRRAGAEGFLAVDTSSPYVDERPLLVAGQPEVREYRMRFYANDQGFGEWTPWKSVTVAP